MSDPLDALLAKDPYLAYQPSFAKSLPVQILVNGITLTLLIVLLLHLLLTIQYHYPLAPLNYCLQLSSVIVVLISVIVKIWACLQNSAVNASYWPYDLDYVAVNVPPSNWNTGEKAAWYLLQALNNGFANITHIQFLTLLYPSRIEARLIIFVLGPLAIASSGLYFTALAGDQKVLDIGDSIRNVLNSTLLLIFTIALALWGLLVNRRRAWRTDGGTAVFGFGSLLLAAVSTSGNFVAVAEDGIEWLPHLLFAAILWQTWLGWWWWVGSGMGIGEVEDLMERAEKKKRKMARRAARQRATTGTTTGMTRRPSLAGVKLADVSAASVNAMNGFTSSVAGILRRRTSTMSRRVRMHEGEGTDVEDGGIEMERLSSSEARHTGQDGRANTTATITGTATVNSPVVTSAPSDTVSRIGFSEPINDANDHRDPGSGSGSGSRGGRTRRTSTNSNSETSSTSATPTLEAPQSVAQLLSFPAAWLQVSIRRIRKAHQEAARRQVLQRADIRQQVFEPKHSRRPSPVGLSLDRNHDTGLSSGEGTGAAGTEGILQRSARAEAGIIDGEGVGWGLGSFGIKEHKESALRLEEARKRLDEERLLSPSNEAGPSRLTPSNNAAEDRDGAVGAGEGGEGEWEDIDQTESSSSSKEERILSRWMKGKQAKDKDKGRGDTGGGRDADGRGREGGAGGAGSGSGWSWWGPLKDWRLSDRTTF